jgi:hypothetical protein
VEVLVQIGPVDARAAKAWTEHMLANLAAIRGQLDKLPFKLPAEVVDELAHLLRQWNDHARDALRQQPHTEFRWRREFDPADVHRLVQYWANLDSLTEEHVERLGIDWSPPEARPFFDALATGVAQALAGGDPFAPYADLLVEHGRTRRDHDHNRG